MELVTFKLLIDIGIGLCSLAKGLINSERGRNAGTWMVNLGHLIEDVASSLERMEYPHATCGKMQYMISRFRGILDGEIDDAELDRLDGLLHGAQNIEMLFGEMSVLDDTERASHIARLRETAGTLQAAGEILEKGL